MIKGTSGWHPTKLTALNTSGNTDGADGEALEWTSESVLRPLRAAAHVERYVSLRGGRLNAF